MDQIIFVLSGTVVTVFYYILSPVKLSERFMGILERLGSVNTGRNAAKPQRARSYYVHGIK